MGLGLPDMLALGAAIGVPAALISRRAVSFAGNLTYKNAKNLHETISVLPVERILIESESPFMVPADYRGKRNMPKYLPITARYMAEMYEMEEEALAAQLWENSCKFFGLPGE